jgi:hypothetical protein
MSIYDKAVSNLPARDIDHHRSDLYLRVTPASTVLVNEYEFKNQVTTFKDNIEHVLWYDIPFAYPFERGV